VGEVSEDPSTLLAQSDPNRWPILQERYSDIRLTRSLTISPRELATLQNRATKSDPTYELTNFKVFFDVSTEKCESLEELANELRRWPNVRSVDIEASDRPRSCRPAPP